MFDGKVVLKKMKLNTDIYWRYVSRKSRKICTQKAR